MAHEETTATSGTFSRRTALRLGFLAAVRVGRAGFLRRAPPQSWREAMRAPSTIAASLAHTMLSWISSEPAKEANPQSAPAITFSRPTTPA